MTRAQQQFVSWFAKNYPAMNEQVQNRIDADQSLAASDATQKPPSIWASIVGGIKDLAPAYLQFRNQKKIMAMQLQRAKQGLPPLNVEQLAPTVRVQAGLSPDIKRFILPAMALIGGLGLFLVLRKLLIANRRRH